MNNNRIQAIILDLGGVLVDFDHTIAARKISRFSNKTPEEIYGLFFDSEVTGLFEQGRISPHDFYLKVKERLNLELAYRDFLPIWNEIFFLTEKNRAVYNLAKDLKNRYRLALLSNVNILHFDYLKKNFPVFDVFHYIFTSCEMGLSKPNPLIYEKALRELDVTSAGDVFYADDRPDLVAQASALGIKAVVFKDALQLKRDLEEVGVQIN